MLTSSKTCSRLVEEARGCAVSLSLLVTRHLSARCRNPHHRTTLNHFASSLVFLLLTTTRAVLSQAFEAAGVDHVVAVRTDAEVLDKAAIMFAKQFYEGLVVSA